MISSDKAKRVKSVKDQNIVGLQHFINGNREKLDALALIDCMISDNENFSCSLLSIFQFNSLIQTYGVGVCESLAQGVKGYLKDFEGVETFDWKVGTFLLVFKDNVSVTSLTNSIKKRFSSFWGGQLGAHHKLHFNMCSIRVDMTQLLLGIFDNPITDLCARLDFGMTRAKENGDLGSLLWNSSLELEYLKYKSVSKTIDDAFKNSSFELYYQPIVNIQTGKVEKAEALIRLRDSETQDFIPPDYFLPLIAESGRMIALGEIVITKACEFIARNNIKQRVYVNLSASHFLDTNLKFFITGTLEDFCLKPSSLGLEIVESEPIIKYQQVWDTISDLSDLGIVCALDDFGTGYTSMAHLHKLPVKNLKLSRELILAMQRDKRVDMMVESVIGIAKVFDLTVTAEGVENITIASRLKELGCDYIQGFLYSRPLNEQMFKLNYS